MNGKIMRALVLSFAKRFAFFLLLSCPAAAQISVLTQRYDSARDGLNANETTLTLSNVNTSTFGKLFSVPVDGRVFAQPLYVPNVSIPGNGIHNVIYIATQHDSVYAYDADGPRSQPLWTVNLATSNCPNGWTCTSVPASVGLGTDVLPEVGITSTPVIDPSTNTLYVVAKTQEISGSTTNFVYRLHALDITAGAERPNSPVVIQGQVPGSGNPNNSGFLVFSPLHSLQRPGLVLVNNSVYIAFGSWNEVDIWHGWLFGYGASSLAQLAVFSVTPNGGEGYGGIWMHGQGLDADVNGYLYFSTGNGGFNGVANYSDSYLKMATPGLTVADYFTPFNQAILDTGDLDVASGGLMLLPDSAGTAQHPHILIGCGKNGAIYVIDRDSMGHYNSSNDSQIIQELLNVIGGTHVSNNSSAYAANCLSSPAYWQGNVYLGGVNDSVKIFSFTNGLMSTWAVSHSSEVYQFPGASPVVSANGSSQGVVWTIENGGTANQQDSSGTTAVLHAYDATNLANELYNSNQVASDFAGAPVKFTMPVVANGKVYVGTQSSVTVYGLFSSLPTVTGVAPNNGPVAGGTAVTITGTNFAAGATVTFGGTAATNVVVVSGTQITATTPAGSAGAVTVTVTVNGQPGSLPNGFTYVVPATVSSVSPNSGSTAGGTAVTITGTNFAAGATVTFGGTATTSVVVVSGTQITATTPAGSAGAVTVTVTVNGQPGSLPNGFTYVVPATVSSVSPNSGSTAGGTAVTITGTNFAAGATVTFGGTAATSVVVVSGTQITATTPAHAAGAVTVTVTNPGVPGGSLASGFTYAVVPTVSSVSPNNGPVAGGTAVTITGTNFAAGATVSFGGTAATSVVVVSGTQITATTPAGSAG